MAIEFGTQIKAVQGDDPGEAVMLDSNGQVPGSGDNEWIQFRYEEEWDQVPVGAIVEIGLGYTVRAQATDWNTMPVETGATGTSTYKYVFIKNARTSVLEVRMSDTMISILQVNSSGAGEWIVFNGGGCIEVAVGITNSTGRYKII